MDGERKEKKKRRRLILIIIFIVCVTVALYSGFRLISIALTYKQARDEYTALQEYTTIQTQEESSEDLEAESEVEEEETVAEPLEVDFEALQAINPDIIGWVYIEVEEISYPIVQGEDNDYYLSRTFEGTENAAGSIFMEYQNSSDFSDPHTIIYGHNMRDGSMFSKLENLYTNEDYLEDGSFWILTPDGAYEYKIFSMQYVLPDADLYTLFFGASDLVTEYITTMASQSLVDLALGDYGQDSKVVTLSTCSTESSAVRFVVQGILVE